MEHGLEQRLLRHLWRHTVYEQHGQVWPSPRPALCAPGLLFAHVVLTDAMHSFSVCCAVIVDAYRFCSPTRSALLTGRLPIHVNQKNSVRPIVHRACCAAAALRSAEQYRSAIHYYAAMVLAWIRPNGAGLPLLSTQSLQCCQRSLPQQATFRTKLENGVSGGTFHHCSLARSETRTRAHADTG